MSLSKSNIQRWYNMLTGKSVWHVNQSIGEFFSVNEVRGYYNNLTEKVIKMPDILDNNELPLLELESGEKVFFPVAVFQYGLGAYDLFLQTQDERYERKFMQCVDWTIEHQDEQGRWNNFSHYNPNAPYGAMAQGEGASLLVRAYTYTKDEKYINAARTAIDYMLLPLEEGGTTKFDGDKAYLMEYTFKGMVLNGTIFAWWGLYDYVLATGDKGKYFDAKENTLRTIINVLPKFTCSYWSIYSLDGLMASPFYHHLHIAQMQAMFQLTGDPIFSKYASRWEKNEKNPLCKSLAFINKAFQKLKE